METKNDEQGSVVAQDALVNAETNTAQNSGDETGTETETTSTNAGIGTNSSNITVAVQNNDAAAFEFATEVKAEISAGIATYDETVYKGNGIDKIVQIKKNNKILAGIYVTSIIHGKKGSEQTYFSLPDDDKNSIEDMAKKYKDNGYKFLVLGYGTAKNSLPELKKYFFSSEVDDASEYTNYPTNGITFTIGSLLNGNSQDVINGPKPRTSKRPPMGLIRRVDVKNIVDYIENPQFISNTSSQTTTSPSTANQDPDPIKAKIAAALDISKQIILTGAPGTGKTYSVREYVKAETKGEESRYKFVQFHPSYDYSDFVEGLRPVQIGEESSSDMSFVRLDGTFKAFCRTIVEKTLECAYEELTLYKWEDLTNESKSELFNKICSIAEKKTKLDDMETEQQTSVEKVKVKDKNNNQIDVNSMNLYDEYADKADENEYYFIIDEVNRADLSKVFGELMFGLEESYRGVENRFDTQYKNLKTYEIGSDGKAQPMAFDCFEKGFFIPDNLYIIGTMNDIDRSVEAFDFALRRRFQWIDIKANEVMLHSLKSMLSKKNITDDKIEWLAGKIIDMNNYLSKSENKYGLTEAYHIGPAYFKTYDPNDSNSLETIFRQRIEPIIREYTRGRSEVDTFISNCKEKLLKNLQNSNATV